MVQRSPAESPVALLIALLVAGLPLAQGGQCWSSMSNPGRCTESLRTNVTQGECCSDGRATTAWSPKDMTSGDLFFWISLGGGVACKPCKVSCDGVRCGRGMKCIMRKQRPACVCAPACTRKKRQMGQVCGSDGNTYKHICRLTKKQCRRSKQLTIEYFGKCQKNCDKVHCSGRGTCLMDQVLRPHCVRCQGQCPRGSIGEYVCGADNVTYSSACHIRQAAGVKGSAVPLAYRGKCKAAASCENIRCRKGQQCLLDPRSGPPRCVTCPRHCQGGPKTEMLCANNNYMYSNWCHMMQDACKHGILLEAKYAGPCEETTSQQTNVIPLNLFDSQDHL